MEKQIVPTSYVVVKKKLASSAPRRCLAPRKLALGQQHFCFISTAVIKDWAGSDLSWRSQAQTTDLSLRNEKRFNSGQPFPFLLVRLIDIF